MKIWEFRFQFRSAIIIIIAGQDIITGSSEELDDVETLYCMEFDLRYHQDISFSQMFILCFYTVIEMQIDFFSIFTFKERFILH